MKKKRFNINTMNWAIAMAVGICFFVIVYVCLGVYYRINDDVLIRDYISGIYRGIPDGHTVYMLYPFSASISLLYKILPYIPWYGLVMIFLQYWCVISCVKRLLDAQLTAWEKVFSVVASLLFCLAYLAKHYTRLHYTVTGGLLMAAACFLFITAKEQTSDGKFVKSQIVPIIMAVLAVFVRKQIGLFLFPLLGMAALLRYFTENKEGIGLKLFWKRYIPVLVIALALIGAGFVSHILAYQSEDWKTFLTFNDARTVMYDYSYIPSYEGAKNFYDEAGISEHQVKLLQNYNIMLDETMDAELLDAINRYTEADNDTFWVHFKSIIKPYGKHVLQGEDAPFNYVVLGLYAVMFFVLLFAKKKSAWICLILTGIVRSALWLFLLYRGRVRERVTEPFMITELMILFGLLILVMQIKKWNMRLPILVVSSVVFLLSAMYTWPKVKEMSLTYDRLAKVWYELQTELLKDGDSFYFLDVYSSVESVERVFDESYYHRLVDGTKAESTGRNNEILGGWNPFSPQMQQKQKKLGIDCAAEALLDADNVYYVTDEYFSTDWIGPFYEWRGTEIEMTEVRRIGYFVVYKISRKQ